VSGQLPIDSDNNSLNGSITEQTNQIAKNIAAILTAAGTDISKVVKTTVFLTDMGDFREMNVAYEKLFTSRPARSCVAVKELPKGFPVEIECIAAI
jgi:2-iminobutanoate/2-iminopropanoate deaminase